METKTVLKDAEGRTINLTRYYPTTRPVVFAHETTKWSGEVLAHSELWMYCEAYVTCAGSNPYRTVSDEVPLNLAALAQVEVTVCVSQRPVWTVALAPLIVQHADFERRLAALETHEKSKDLGLRFAAIPPYAQRSETLDVHLSSPPAALGLKQIVLLFGTFKEDR